jgi:hypothetical protein
MSYKPPIMMIALGLALSSVRPASALNLLYDFEGDNGTTAVDKISSDGTQNGATLNSVDTADTFLPAFGTQSAFFDNPLTGTGVPPWSTLEVPDTTFGADYSLTLAAFVNQDFTQQKRVRVFSSFQGTGPVADRLLLDFSNTGATANVRAIVDGTSYTSPAVAAAGTAGYHHIAMTLSAGAMKLYFDGAEVMTGAIPAGYTNNKNLFIGEDPHDGGGTANEQFLGNIDEALVLQRALSAVEIGQLAVGATVSSVVTPLAAERAVYYDFESDAGSSATDKFTLDGSQNGVKTGIANVDANPANAKLGSSSYFFTDPRINDPLAFSQINAGPIGSLGTKFTISAVLNPLSSGQTGNGFARVFSSYLGSGSTAGQLILDFNPLATTGASIRLYLPSNTGAVTLQAVGAEGKIDLLSDTNQTLTAVYDNGEVTLYLDGVAIKTTTTPVTEQTLGVNDLRIGEDRGGYVGTSANENFVGTMDDVLVLDRALTPEQVMSLHAIGAVATIAALPPDTVAGDFDGDEDVDGNDFLVWQRELGAGAGSPADGNGDGIVDGLDLTQWKDNFGSSSATAIAANVPEPTAGSLSLFIAAVFAAFKRRRAVAFVS